MSRSQELDVPCTTEICPMWGPQAPIERIRLVSPLSPSRYCRIAGQPVKVHMIVWFIFRTTGSSRTSRASVGFDTRKAAALRLIHLEIAHRAR